MRIALILEDKVESEGKVSVSPSMRSMCSREVRARIYVWPLECRPKTRKGSMVLCMQNSSSRMRSRLFLSSANLTEFALNLNLELGLLSQVGTLLNELRRTYKP